MCRIRVGQGYLRVGNKDFKKGGGLGGGGQAGSRGGCLQKGGFNPVTNYGKTRKHGEDVWV